MSLVHENGARTGPARRPEARGRPAPGSPAMLQALQRSAGNAAASAYVQRLAESPGPATSAAVSPQNDPRFQTVAAKVTGQGGRLRRHPPPRGEARKAADAAAPPATDKEAKAKASQADTMSTAKPGGFDKAGFIAAVKKAIAAQAPKNLDEAENFEKSGKAESVKTEVSGKVTEGKKASAQDIEEKTAAAPDTSKVSEKSVTPLRPEPQPAPPRVNTAAAMPAPVPAARTDLSGDQRETDNAMTEAGVTEQQLATSNEPEFTDALAAKKEGEEHSATAPAAFRETEAAQLGAAKQEAQGAGAAGLAGMLATKKGSLSGASAGKTAAKTQEEAERARIATQIKAIFDATKTDVDAILGGLDAKVDLEFSTGEAAVRKAFTADLDARMDEYKRKRYSGPGGSARWTWDLFAALPEEANRCYTEARKLYEQDMSVLIGRVADLIGKDLTAAKDRIAKGRADINAYVKSQPKNLQKLAQQAASQFAAQFDQLESDVGAKKDALVDDLATKYSESKAAVEEEITAMQEENKGLWSKAKAAVGGAIRTIIQLKDLLTSALARAAGAIGKIIKDPIGFLGKFVNAVKGGIVRFGENIAEHLKTGLQGWLLSSLSAAGIELPAKFDLKGIIGLVLSLLGLTWPAIRARIAKHVPEKVMSAVEKSVAFIQVILSEGVGGLWKWVVEKLGDIKEMVMGQIREFVITKIVKAGITWLISMLNPAAAFIKACKMIYDVVMFFVEKAAQIKEFVDAVFDSVESIASGGVGAVAGYIEKTLAKMVPVLLGFLASLLGLGGISERIKEIIAKVQKPVGKVIDKLVAGAVKVGKKLLKKLSGAFQKGQTFVRKKLDIKEETPEQKKRRLDLALKVTATALRKLGSNNIVRRAAQPIIFAIKARYRLTSLKVVPSADDWTVHGALNPKGFVHTGIKVKLKEMKESIYGPLIEDARLAQRRARDIHRTDYKQSKRIVVAVPGIDSGRESVHEIQGLKSMRGAEREMEKRRRKPNTTHLDPDTSRGLGSPERWTRMFWRIEEELSRFPERIRRSMGYYHRSDYAAKKQRMVFELGVENAFAEELRTLRSGEKSELPKPRNKRELASQERKQKALKALQQCINELKKAKETGGLSPGNYYPQQSGRDRGSPGRAALVHAEKNAIQRPGTRVVGVSTLPMCSDCQVYFRARALATQSVLVVRDTKSYHVFLSDGSVNSTDSAAQASAPRTPTQKPGDTQPEPLGD